MTLFPTTIGDGFYQPMVLDGLIRINRFGVADDTHDAN